MNPRARISGLTVVEQDGGLLIRDADRNLEHSLHPLTAFVWKLSDGETPVPEIAARVREALGPDVTDAQVWAAIDVLTGAGLLENRIAPPAATERLGRRDLLRQVAAGTVAAAAIGAISVPELHAASKQKGGRDADRGHESAKESAGKVEAEDRSKRAAEQGDKRAAHRQESEAKRFERVRAHQAYPGGKPLALADGWTNCGGDFQEAAWSHTGDLVVLSGLVQPTSGATSLVATLPRQAWPPRALVFPAFYLDGARDSVARIDILPDGRVVMVSSLNGTTCLSLSGIVFRKLKPRAAGEPGDGTSEQASKDSAAQEELDKAQEQDDKQAAEQTAKGNDQEISQKESSDKEADAKEASDKGQEASTKESSGKQQEQGDKQATEQLQKQQAETQAKVEAEQDTKNAEQASKESDAKEAEQKSQEAQAKESQDKQQAEAEQKAQQEQLAKQKAEQKAKAQEQLEKQAAEEQSKEQTAKESQNKQQAEAEQKEQLTKQKAEQQAKAQEQLQKQAAEEQSKEYAAKEADAKQAEQVEKQAEQVQKQKAEQAAKEQGAKEQAAKEQAAKA